MAMTPEEKTEFENLKQIVESLLRVENVAFIESIKRRLNIQGELNAMKLNDLNDVDTTGVTNSQVIKYSSSTKKWVPANDIDT